MRYYIADNHFFHRSLLTKMDQRDFDSVEEMNDYMIEQWNKKVRKNDEVVILGDFSWGDLEQTQDVLDRLKGKLFMIRGNHDYFLDDKQFDASQFGWIKDYAELNDNRIILLLVTMDNIVEMKMETLRRICCMGIFIKRKINSYWMPTKRWLHIRPMLL